MNKHKVLWLIAGIALMAAGVFLLDVHFLLGTVSFIAGMAVLILLSISWMRVSGSVKENYFSSGRGPAERFSPGDVSMEEPVNVWDQITEKKGDEE